MGALSLRLCLFIREGAQHHKARQTGGAMMTILMTTVMMTGGKLCQGPDSFDRLSQYLSLSARLNS